MLPVMEKLCPCRDPNHPKYLNDPNFIWHSDRWLTPEGVEKRKAAQGAAQARYEASEGGKAARARYLASEKGKATRSAREARYFSNLDNRRKKMIYDLLYYHKRKKERYGDTAITFGNHGEEDRKGLHRPVA